MKPSLTISRTENFPEANTIALGGVATGSIKAKLALMVAGIIKIFGSTFAVFAAITRIGNKIVVVAVLLVTSVKKVITTKKLMEQKSVADLAITCLLLGSETTRRKLLIYVSLCGREGFIK